MIRASMAHIEVRPESIKRNELIVDPSRLFRRKLKHREGPRWERPEWPSKGSSWRLQGAFFHFSKFKREDFCCQGEDWLRINVCHSHACLISKFQSHKVSSRAWKDENYAAVFLTPTRTLTASPCSCGKEEINLIYSTKRQWAAASGRLALDPWWVWDPYHSHHRIARKFSKFIKNAQLQYPLKDLQLNFFPRPYNKHFVCSTVPLGTKERL